MAEEDSLLDLVVLIFCGPTGSPTKHSGALPDWRKIVKILVISLLLHSYFSSYRSDQAVEFSPLNEFK